MSLSVNRKLQSLDIMLIKRFQYYTAEDFRKNFRIIVVIFTTLLFVIQVKIGKFRAKALIDLGVTKNFINEEFARKIDYKKKVFKKLYGLSIFNETFLIYNNNKIIFYSGKVKLQIDDFKERRSFDIIYLGRLNLILGLFQL